MNKSYYKFTEHNDYEGETWHFYLPLTEEEVRYFNELEIDEDSYEFSDEPIEEKEVDILVKHSDSGYMANHNKVSEIKWEWISENLNEDEDPFYKGQPFIIE